MSQKIINIMKILNKEFNIPYQQQGDNQFEVQTAIYEVGHRTLLHFEISSDIIRCETVHIFGFLNAEQGISNDDLLNLLRNNYFGTVRGSSAYVGIKIIEGRALVCLNSCLIFNDKWEARDMAHMINVLP